MYERILHGENSMNEQGFEVGDLVYWAEDNDVGIVIEVEEISVRVKWQTEPEKSGWYPSQHWSLRRMEDEREKIQRR